MDGSYAFTAKLWIYGFPEAASWYFLTVPQEYAEEIKARTSDYRRGFGSVRVTATIGSSTWQTSIFPDNKSGSYLLPVKKEVRAKEGMQDGDEPHVVIAIA